MLQKMDDEDNDPFLEDDMPNEFKCGNVNAWTIRRSPYYIYIYIFFFFFSSDFSYFLLIPNLKKKRKKEKKERSKSASFQAYLTAILTEL